LKENNTTMEDELFVNFNGICKNTWKRENHYREFYSPNYKKGVQLMQEEEEDKREEIRINGLFHRSTCGAS